jgi:microcystin-dependent protein
MAASIVNPRSFRRPNEQIDYQPYFIPIKDLYIHNINIHLGSGAGQPGPLYNSQGTGAVAIGGYTAQNTQGRYSVAVGYEAAQQNQGNNSIAIGYDAGQNNQGTNCVAIGSQAGNTNQADNSIILNAQASTSLDSSTEGFFVKPVRNIDYDINYEQVRYNPTLGEFTWSHAIPGIISMYGGVNSPTGYLFCNGQAISRTTYSRLFSVIGTIYGNGDGVNTFNVPNLQGRVPVGLKPTETIFNTLGNIGGTGAHTLSIDEMPAHTHTYLGVNSQNAASGVDNVAENAPRPTETTSSTGGNQAHNNLQPYIVLNYIISF